MLNRAGWVLLAILPFSALGKSERE